MSRDNLGKLTKTTSGLAIEAFFLLFIVLLHNLRVSLDLRQIHLNKNFAKNFFRTAMSSILLIDLTNELFVSLG